MMGGIKNHPTYRPLKYTSQVLSQLLPRRALGITTITTRPTKHAE